MIGRNTDAAEKLTAYAQRMERLQEEIEALREDLKQLKAEARGDGFNVQALTKLVSIRRNKKSADKESELLSDLVLYAYATGTPLDVVMPDEDMSQSGHGPSPGNSDIKPAAVE